MGGPARPLLERRAVVAVHDSGSLCTVTPKRPVMHAVRLRRKQLQREPLSEELARTRLCARDAEAPGTADSGETAASTNVRYCEPWGGVTTILTRATLHGHLADRTTKSEKSNGGELNTVYREMSISSTYDISYECYAKADGADGRTKYRQTRLMANAYDVSSSC